MSSEYGFEKERFLNLTTDNFDCIICTLVARDPKDCSNCGNVFCSSCIDDWIKKKNECPNRCPKNEAKIAPV
jgi:E3 ubiquitin-protein ligase NRDP1